MANFTKAQLERRRRYAREYRLKDLQKHAERVAAWRSANPERAKELSKNWKEANHDKVLLYRINAKRAKYDISDRLWPGILSRLLKGPCDICGILRQPEEPRLFDIDHDHITKKFRGVLCSKHNLGIGKFNDEPTILRRAARYLETHREHRPLYGEGI